MIDPTITAVLFAFLRYPVMSTGASRAGGYMFLIAYKILQKASLAFQLI